MKGPNARWLELREIPPDLKRPAVWLVRNDDPAWEALVTGLRPSAADLADAALFGSPARSAARLARRILLKTLAGRALGVATETITVERSASGAIRLTAPEPLHASLSARDGWSMLALARVAVGADLETARPPHPLPLDVLTPDEARDLLQLAPSEQPAAFARYWTAKEAVLKAAGTGLNVDPAALAVRFAGAMGEITGLNGRSLGRSETRMADGVVATVAIVASEV